MSKFTMQHYIIISKILGLEFKGDFGHIEHFIAVFEMDNYAFNKSLFIKTIIEFIDGKKLTNKELHKFKEL